MKKLVEREDAPRTSPLATAPALGVQFFLIPLAVVAVVVAIYAGFRLLVVEERTAQDYLNDIRVGGRDRRWPAAFELSRLMADPALQQRDPTLGPALVQAFVDAEDDDPRVRRYLALALGRLKPAPPAAVPRLVEALGDADSETRISAVWALAAIGDPSAVPPLRAAYASEDPGIRKVVVYALGALPGDEQVSTLRAALADPVADVQWNAALALARHGDRSAIPVLRRMIDRPYVRQAVTRTTSGTDDTDPVDEVMISALGALGALQDPSTRDAVERLSRDDPSLRVRQAALEALRQLAPPESAD